MRSILTLILCLLSVLATGCSSLPVVSAAFDVLNAAETAKTGYDMAVGVGGRRMIEVSTSQDDEAEARLRALLEAQNGRLAQASAHVIEGHAYVVGVYDNVGDLDRAKRLAASVPGVRRTTLCLFPADQRLHAANSDGEMRDIILRLSGVRTRDVLVRVVQGNAVLLGSVKNATEREKLLTSAKNAGALSVQNHLHLFAAN